MEELLIENVRKHVCIYNVKSLEYRDSHIRQTAWEEIGRELKISASEAKDRWEKLRRCFCNARNRRREETRSGMASKKKTLWKYELQMDFLTPFIETRKTHDNLSGPSAEEEEGVTVRVEIPDTEVSGDGDVGTEQNTSLEEEQEQPNFDAQIERTDRSKQDAGKRYETFKESQVKKRQKLIDTQGTEILQILKENSDRRKKRYEENTKLSSKNIAEPMDEMDMFYLSMSRMTKRLPKVKQAEIKLAVSNAVLSAEILNEKQLFFQRPNDQQHSDHQVPVQSSSLASQPPNSRNPSSSPTDGFYYSKSEASEPGQTIIVQLVDQQGNIIQPN